MRDAVRVLLFVWEVGVPLSESEQKVLDDLERDLYNSESDILADVTSRPGFNPRLIVFGVLTVLFGVGIMVAGVLVQLPLASLFGFAIMFLGVFMAFVPSKPKGGFFTRFLSKH
ncbi:unknown [Tropheryma whipplei str. Twist]|uniref:DUF3040 domain-containing protein n=1 Tax=Tropheryma whipplei (strain Twist) TaxID=203267 RepID=Q83GN8_TROWT|nr:unknown [Tropheryma whipplei str. Twist]